MNFNLENFGDSFKTIDLVLYAGVAVVVYVLFQEKIHGMLDKIKDLIKNKKQTIPYFPVEEEPAIESDDVFFALIQSWKQTRDLAEEYGAYKAVKIADEMFPHLVPKEEVVNNEE